MTLKELRLSKGITQKQAAEVCGVSLRSYVMFENGADKAETPKYKYMHAVLEKFGAVDEAHGILTTEAICTKVAEVLREYDVSYCFLFGSYAKGLATETSDVDLLVATSVSGMRFFGMAEKLRTALSKKVDLLDLHQLENNSELLNEILKDGIRIYEQH